MSTQRHLKNLQKLADYLLSLPVDYDNFGMSMYCADKKSRVVVDAHKSKRSVKACGSVACAVGHGPSAGIPANYCETWASYAWRAFGISMYGSDFDWLFSHAWANIDNTPHGAARRILYFLENGIPENVNAQMTGQVPLVYKPEA